MAAKGKRKARLALTLAAYALAGLLTSLGIAWTVVFVPVRSVGSADGYWLGPAEAATVEVPAGSRVWIIRHRDWRSVRYTRVVLYDDKPSGPRPLPPSDAAAIAAELRGRTYSSTMAEMDPDGPTLPEPNSMVCADYRGFPCSCVWAWWALHPERLSPNTAPNSYVEIKLGRRWLPDEYARIPVTPLWPGLIANTAIWAFAWFALLYFPLRLLPWSAASRRRRGLCIACGYDLTGTQGRCPECGVASCDGETPPGSCNPRDA